MDPLPRSKIDPKQLGAFGRAFFLLFNRSTMYASDHPYCRQAVDEFLPVIQDILQTHSPLVFIMNQEKFFIDEEPLDPRINTGKMVSHFKKGEIYSISFYEGLSKQETLSFVEIFTSLNKYHHVDSMKTELKARGVAHIKINHVFFKKVSKDEEIVSRQDFEMISGQSEKHGLEGPKKRFIDLVLESVLMEEFEKTLTIKHLAENPDQVSQQMIDTDLSTYRNIYTEDKQPGLALAHQLQVMEDMVEKHLAHMGGGTDSDNGPAGGEPEEKAAVVDRPSGGPGNGIVDGDGEGGGPELTELASAVFAMKRQLINGLELQKSLGVSYPNEQEILDKADEITDKVLIQLVKDEYKSGKISTARMARIIKRLVPDALELKRLMPKIKAALLEEGMPLSDYLELVQALSNELQSEELTKILQQSAEEVGLDGANLIQKVKTHPVQAAELIFLAAEIRKETGDERILTDLLVDYVERIGSKLALDEAKQNNIQDGQHLKQVVNQVESQILGRLKHMDIQNNVFTALEEKLNNRMDELCEKLKGEWAASLSADSNPADMEKRTNLSVLQILEQSVDESDELGNILRMIRRQAESRNFDENDVKRIFEEISRHKEEKKRATENKLRLAGVLDADGLKFFLEKEIARAVRYDLPFATLSFSVVSAKSNEKPVSGEITQQGLIEAVLQRLAAELRGADVAALVDKNKLVAFLPMTPADEAKLALKRHLRLLNTQPVQINHTPVFIRVAGAITNFSPDRTPDAAKFLDVLSSDLLEMVNRIKNIHGLI